MKRETEQYRLESRIGKGSFGQVFKATHITTGKVVAIKVCLR
jgi:serine/threonine protein kinase